MALTAIGKWDIAGFSYCPNIAFYGIPHNMISLIELRGSSIVFTGHCSISRAQDPVYHIMKTIPILSRKKKKKPTLAGASLQTNRLGRLHRAETACT